MNETLLLIIVLAGGGAGLAIVGVAFWIMRQEGAAGTKGAAAGALDHAAGQAQSTGIPAGAAGLQPAEAPQSVAPAPPDSAADLASTESTPAAADAGARLRAEAVPGAAPTDSTPAAQPDPPSPGSPAGWLSALTGRASANPGAPVLTTQELLKLLRTPEGDLIVEVYGQRYRTRAEITDDPIEKQIANASRDLQNFLGAELPQPLKAAPPATLPPRKAPSDNRTVVKVSLEEAAQMELKPPSMDIVRQWRYVRDQQLKPQVQIKSVMEEIDEVLQVMLIGTPLAGRGLKATDGSHGAVFTFDGRNYDSVDAVPDPEAREMLRTAIQKWDQKR